MNQSLKRICRYLYKFLLKQKRNLKDKNTRSYTMYKYCLIIFLMQFVILLIISPSIYDMSFYLIVPLFFCAFLLDMIWIIKKLWKTIFGKISYTLIGYFSYSISISTAKDTIYLDTLANPDSFEASIHFFSGIFLIPSVFFILSIFISILIIMYYVTFFCYLLLKFIPNFDLILSKFLKKRFKLKTNNTITENRIIIQSAGFVVGTIIFCFIAFYSISNIYKLQNTSFTRSMIVMLSYYPLDTKVCNNKAINNNAYIKLLDNNEVSVSDYNSSDKFFDNNIKFTTVKCNI